MPMMLIIDAGDFSFAHSLITQHRCKNVLATCYDSKEVLYQKYPQAEGHVQEILNGASKPKEHGGNTISNTKPESHNRNQGRVGWSGSDGHEKQENEDVKGPNGGKSQQRPRPNVLFSVDARKLGHASGGGKDVRFGFSRTEFKPPVWQEAKKSSGTSSSRKGGPWDIICFNFPHVGGLSTDVNRQVRANQELLVAFFKTCVPLLSSCPSVVGVEVEEDEDGRGFSTESGSESQQDDEGDPLGSRDTMSRDKSRPRSEPGQILVTLFEGEPYTLWNIKDLARHAGLRVVTSFRFPWASYKGYSHARTLGEIEGKHGGRGGWRGENREARMYVFEFREDHTALTGISQPSKKDSGMRNKRARASDSDDSD
jgi:25S rRNA (uracil2634-N3)-methyltransferase